MAKRSKSSRISQRHYMGPEQFSRSQSFRSSFAQAIPLVRIRKRRYGNWIKIVIDGKDYTPRPLTTDSFPSTALDGSWDWDMTSTLSSQTASQITLAGTMTSLAVIDERPDVLDIWDSSEGGELAPPSLCDDKLDEAPVSVSESFTILLQESSTIFLLQLPLHWVVDDSQMEPGSPIMSADVMIQTLGPRYRSSLCQTPNVVQETVGETVHRWHIYDSMWPKRRRQKLIRVNQLPGAVSSELPKKLFAEATLWLERFLFTSNLQARQMEIHRKPPPPVMGIKYNLEPLWTFRNECPYGTSITAMTWNKYLPDLLAVGYGKFNFKQQSVGAVSVWCFKNPGAPERHYTFEEPVTALTFSYNSPNLLGVSFYDGLVMIVDVSSPTARILAQCDRLLASSFSPIWQLCWTDEGIVAMGDDGRICRYTRSRYSRRLNCEELATLFELKGMNKARASALVVKRHTGRSMVANEDGDLRVFHDDFKTRARLLKAHDGPIYVIQYSPFEPKVFLTAAADGLVRVWVDDVNEPLVTVGVFGEDVTDAAWHPRHAPIIVTLTGCRVVVWDLRRRSVGPASETVLESQAFATAILFHEVGSVLAVGDTNGLVHLFLVRNFPYEPYFQSESLVEALRRGLESRPWTLRKFKEAISSKEDQYR